MYNSVTYLRQSPCNYQFSKTQTLAVSEELIIALANKPLQAAGTHCAAGYLTASSARCTSEYHTPLLSCVLDLQTFYFIPSFC